MAAQTAIGTALVGVGVSVLGTLLVNALIPPIKPENRTAENRYSISGWKNPIDPNGAVPEIMGQLRVAPPFAALPHTEIVGDFQYIRALFCLGYGPLEINDLRIGETSISEFNNLDVEIRYGRPGDLPISLFPQQIAEESIGLELVKPLPRNDLGEVVQIDEPYLSWEKISGTGDDRVYGWVTRYRKVDAPGIETPVVRTSGADAVGASVILGFPSGMVSFDDEGRSRSETVKVRIEHRLVQAENWQLVTELEITANKLEGFFRQHTWQFPSRGRWQVRITMLTDESVDTRRQRRTSWVALQTLRPEYPLNFDKPLALAAVRVKATHQLSGALDNFNAMVRRLCLDWNHETGTWVERVTSNPASLFRLALQSPANPRPSSDAGIDLETLQDWHDFCRLKALKYDRELVSRDSLLRDVLAEIAAAGRAAPRHDGLRWSVVIDRPDLPIIDHLSPRNSVAHRSTHTYLRHPDAFRIPFLDVTNDYKPAERFVPRPGLVGEPELTEEMPMSGKTDPAEVYREGLRRWYEVLLRPDTYELTQDAPLRVATRGDHIVFSTQVLDRVLTALRVRWVEGNLIEIDGTVDMEAGKSYAIRFRVYDGENDAFGRSIDRTIETHPGETGLLTLTGAVDDRPVLGDIIHFGPAGEESYRLLVTGIEAGDGFSSIMRAVDAAPEIDALVDAAEIPAWSGRVGSEIDQNLLQPGVPRFRSISSGISGTSSSGLINYLIEPSTGVISAASYGIGHKLASASTWTEITIPAANGGGAISGYAQAANVQMRVRAVSYAGVAGPWSNPVSFIIGAGDAAIPDALDADAINITTLMGGALVQVATGADAATTRIQLYRSTDPDLDRTTDAVGEPYAVAPLQSYSFALGDTTRSNLIADGGFDNPATWTAGANWEVVSSQAQHTAGAADAIGQSFPAVGGRWYRIGYGVGGRTAGSVTPRLTGATVRPGAAASGNGERLDRIQAVTGNSGIEWLASDDFDGAIDFLVAYLETAACLEQGTHYLWAEPQNADGVPGPISVPFTLTII